MSEMAERSRAGEPWASMQNASHGPALRFSSLLASGPPLVAPVGQVELQILQPPVRHRCGVPGPSE